MRESLLNRILKNRKRQTRSLALVLCLSMLVSLGTFADFRGTATAEEDYERGILDCPYTREGAEPVAHVHNDDCYEGNTLVCTLPEVEAHTHSDACYTERQVLVCTQKENAGHQHTAECYETVQELTCDKPELLLHVHGPKCFHTEENTDAEPEEITVAESEETIVIEPEAEMIPVSAEVENVVEETDSVIVMTTEEEEKESEETIAEPEEPILVSTEVEDAVEETDSVIVMTTEEENKEPEEITFDESEETAEAEEPDGFIVMTTDEEEEKEPEEIIADESEETTEPEETKETEETNETAEEVTAPEVSMPAQSWERTAGGIKITVDAPEGAFPENTKIAVTPMNGDSLKDTVSDAVSGKVLEVQAVDITFFDEDGHEIEPAVPIRVVMTPADSEHAEEKASVVHIDMDQLTADLVEQAEGTEEDNSEVVFDADAFSVYAIVYTIEFEYEVDGETYTSASMPGAENMPLADVIRGLSIVSEEEVDTFASKISTVASTDEAVAVVDNTDAGLCVRVLKDGDAQIVITMQDGAQFRIDVEADGETTAGNETATVSTVGDLYLPAEAKLEAKALDEAQSESAIAAVQAAEETEGSTAAAETAYQVFDISLENVEADQYNGFQVEVTLPENVVGRDFRLFHIHDGETTEIELNTVSRPADDSGLEVVSGFTFETKDFSAFVLRYTVDFEYNGFSFSLIGNGSMLLSELFAALEIEESTENIAYVEFSDYALLSIESTGADYLLISRMPFQSEETLTVAMTSGVIYAITVTDAQDWDITGTLENVEIVGADIGSDGKLIVVDGQYYTVNLTFRENDVTQFVNDGTTMEYTLPAGISVGNTSGTFTMDFGSLGKLENNTFRVENNTVYVNWNTSNQQMMEILKAADEAHFELSIETMFDKHFEHIQWSTEISTDLQVDEPHEADVEKTGKYNAETDKIEYTVTVSSTGTTSGIKITDEITGTALTSDVNSVNDITVTIKHKDGTTSTVTPTGFTKSENGFVLNLPDMADGDVYTVNYTASVQYDKLGRNGQTTYLETNNGVVLEYHENPEPEYDNSYGYNINYSSFSKSSTNVGNVIEDSTGKYRLVDYRITANTEKKTSVSKIYDSIDNSSRNIMTMNGTGIIVTVTKEDGTTETRTITWGEDGANGKLTKTDDYSWIYYPPETDGKASYVIDYQTRVDMTNVNTTVNVKNNGGDDHSGSGSNTGITPDEDDTIELKKSVNSYSAEEVEWSIDLTVPKRGLDKAVLTDILPVSGKGDYYDFYKSVDVKGLLEGETYKLTAKWKVWGQWDYEEQIVPITYKPDDTTDGVHPPIQTEIYITFYKGENEEGLKASSSSRVITATITTENNQEWLKAAENDYWNYYKHKNTAKIGELIREAEVSPAIKKITKQYENQGELTKKDGKSYRYYKYNIVLQGLTDERIEIIDTFDADVFEVLNLNDLNATTYQHYNPFLDNGKIYDGQNFTTYPKGDSHSATLTPTPQGCVISTAGLDRDENGFLYNCYKVEYYLVVKNPELAQQKAFNAGGTVKFTNSVNWDGATSKVDVEYGHPIIDKTCAKDRDKATFTIVINPDRLKLNNGNTMTLTDEFSSTLSIDYSSVNIVTDPADATVTYDYYGNKGVFKVPDETKVTITYTCKIIGTGNVHIWNKAVLDSGYKDEYEDYVIISSSGEGGADVFAIYLLKYASANMQAGTLAGAKFRILDSELNPVLYTDKAQDADSAALIGQPVTFTTEANGKILILLSQAKHGVTLKRNTVYYLEEIEAPQGYQLDPTLYSFVISDDPNHANYTREDGVWVYYVGDILKIRNYPEELKLLLTKRFAGNVKLTDEQKSKIKFIVERVDEAGSVITGEGAFQKEISYSALRNDKYELTEKDGLVAGYYKVTETQDGLDLPDNVVAETTYSVTADGTTITESSTVIDRAEVISSKTTNVIFTNSYSSGAYYFTKLEAGTEQPLKGAVFTVYKADDESTGITTYTTGDDGKFMISRAGENESILDVNTLYYVVETAAPEGYSIPNPAPKYYFYFGTEDASAPQGATQNAAVNLYAGSASQTVLNASDTSIMVKKEWFDGNGNELSENEKKDLSATVTLKRRVQEQNGDPVEDSGFSKQATLNYQNNWYTLWEDLEKTDASGATYSYYVKEVNVPDGFTVTYSNNDGIQSGTITVKNTKQEQKGALKLTKLVTVNGETTTGTAADGTYTFTVTNSGTPQTINKTIVITVTDGVAVSATVDGEAVNLVGGFVVISGLTPGNYTITEAEPTNGTSLSKINGENTTSYSTTVTVVAGETVGADATATFTNDLRTISVEATKVWKNGDSSIRWPEDVANVEFTLYKTVNGTESKVDQSDLTDYWSDPTKFSNPILVTNETANAKAVWDNLPTRVLVTTMENVEGTAVTTAAWSDVTYTIKETKINYVSTSVKAAENVSVAADNNNVITNTPTTSIHVSKEWQGKDGTVLTGTAIPNGAKVTFTLMNGKNPVTTTTAAGEETSPTNRTVTLTGTDATHGGTVTPESNDYEGPVWTAYFTNLPVYDAEGKVITYTVQETVTWPGYALVTTGEDITYPAVNDGKIINRESTMALDILKVDNAGTTITTGAKFRIVQISDTAEIGEITGTEEESTTGTDGKLTFENLAVGFYKITEMTPPPGYMLPPDTSFYVEVTESRINLLTKEDEKKPSEWDKTKTKGGIVRTFTQKTETANAQVTVENTSGTPLPETGGIGTALFTALGGLMTATAGAVLTLRRKRKS